MKRLVPVLIILVLLCSCWKSPQTSIKAPPLRSEKIVLVQFFEFPPQIATDVQPGAVRHFGEFIAYDIQTWLKKSGFPKVIAVKPGESISGDILVRGAIIRVSGGNYYHRLFGEVFGFGASEVRADGELIDIKAGIPLTGFSIADKSRWTSLKNEAAVRENLSAVARQIAQVVAQYE